MYQIAFHNKLCQNLMTQHIFIIAHDSVGWLGGSSGLSWFGWGQMIWDSLTCRSGASSGMREQWVWPEPLSMWCLASSRGQGQACSCGGKRFPPERASTVSNLLLSHSAKVIRPSPVSTNRKTRTTQRLLAQQFTSDDNKNPASNVLRNSSQLKKYAYTNMNSNNPSQIISFSDTFTSLTISHAFAAFSPGLT